MTDNHVHIGQFEDVFYNPLEVADVIMSAGMEGFSFSSTSSCIDDVQYGTVEKEISGMLSGMPYAHEAIVPYFWYIPDYIKQGITIKNASGVIPYRGIKVHPYAHNWDFENPEHLDSLYSLFDYADNNKLPVLIHTGHSGVDSADRFQRFFSEYKSVKFTLAHCRPLDSTLKMLEQYANIYCDTAFVPAEDIQTIINRGFKRKIIFGADFPITHFWQTKYPREGQNPAITLEDQYQQDIANRAILRDNDIKEE
jgi:predicted TIM-barrel fold metal-dependent hydrolase